MARVPITQRRDDFIRAAVEVIAEHGVDGVTTRRIAEAANAPLPTLHYCFSSKEEVLFAIYERQFEHFGPEAVKVAEGAGLGETAKTLLVQINDWWVDQADYAQAQEELYLWLVRRDPELALKVVVGSLDVLVELLKTGMAESDDAELVEPLARLVTSIADGMMLQYLAYRDRDRYRADLELACAAIDALVASRRS